MSTERIFGVGGKAAPATRHLSAVPSEAQIEEQKWAQVRVAHDAEEHAGRLVLAAIRTNSDFLPEMIERYRKANEVWMAAYFAANPEAAKHPSLRERL